MDFHLTSSQSENGTSSQVARLCADDDDSESENGTTLSHVARLRAEAGAHSDSEKGTTSSHVVILSTNDDDSSDSDDEPHTFGHPDWPTRDPVIVIKWGTAHPEYNKPKSAGGGQQRISWSTAEILYIKKFVDDTTANNNNERISMPNSRCWKQVMNDARAIPIFHKNHVLDSSRFASGFEAYTKYLAKHHIEA